MTRNSLPVHPRTGLRAIFVRKDGTAVYPIMGGAANAVEAAAEAVTAAEAAITAHDEKMTSNRSTLLELGNKGDLDADETTRFDALSTERETLVADRAALVVERDKLATRSTMLTNLQEEFEAGHTEGSAPVGQRSTSRSRTVNPFENYQASRSMPVADVTSRARLAVEQAASYLLTDAQRSRIDNDLASDRSGNLAKHFIAGQNPDYVSAFEKLALGQGDQMALSDAERSAVVFAEATKRGILEGTGSAGGFLVPPTFDPTIINTAENSTNPLRQLVDVKSINGPSYTAPSVGAITVGYVGETVEVNESSPTFGEVNIVANKLGGYVKASTEALEDTGVASVISELLQNAKDEKEAAEFLAGDGATGHIQGILTGMVAAQAALANGAPPLVVPTGAAGVFDEEDIYSLIGSIAARFRGDFKWLAEYNFYLRARTLAKDNDLGAFWTNLNGDNPPQLVGKPTYEASQMPTKTIGTNYTAGQKVLIGGDFKSAYRIVDRRGMVIEFDSMVKGADGRPTGERAWYATWRTGGKIINARALRVLASS